MPQFLGIDIGGTKCAVSIGSAEYGILSREQVPTEGSPSAMLSRLSGLAETLVHRHGPIAATGIVCGGPLDVASGLVMSPPNLPAWDSIPVVAHFRHSLRVPAFLQNDANAGALAEWKHGAGRGSRNLLFCTMGTGFGCGLILNDALYAGASGNAGELGHVRLSKDGPLGFGKTGSVEGWCGGSGIAHMVGNFNFKHRYAGSDATPALTAKDVAMAAEAGEPWAIEVFEEVGRRLGEALAIAIDLINPDTIVIGSIFVRQEKRIRPAMEARLKEECLPESLSVCRIVPASLGESIGDIAALCVAQSGLDG